MEKKSRFELIKIVEAQKDQLSRYETRLRDVVRAYKNLLQEKEALEASVNVLTTTSNQSTKSSYKKQSADAKDQNESAADEKNSNSASKGEGATSPLQEDGPHKEGVLDHPLAIKEDEAEDGKQLHRDEENSSQAEQTELESQQEKITTLSASLATVMQQKSKMEANYQADKKKMMQERETKVQEHEEQTDKLNQTVETLEEQLQELKLRMRHEQQAREEEQNNHVLMLRELQMLVSTERSAKEDLEQQLEDAKEKILLTKRLPANKTEEYERQISRLQFELQGVQRRLKEAERVSSQPSPLLVQLQSEMSKMKKEHAEAVLREQKRVNDAEERLRIITSLEECRVADLEVKLSELSEVVGTYEKLRLQDQHAIQKLKDRLQKMDVENATLTRQISTDENQMPDNERELEEDVTPEELKKQVFKLKGLLRIAWDSSDKPLDLGMGKELSKSELESLFVNDPSHKVCQQELRQLKEEFERYKVKTQALHKNKSYKELSEQLENLEKLKKHNTDLEKQIEELKDSSNEKEQDQRKVITNLRDQLKLSEDKHKCEKEESVTVYKQKLEELERQVLKQRERTLALVAEKDLEIEVLRSRSPSSSPSAVDSGVTRAAFSYQRKFVEMTGGSQAMLDSPQSSEADAAVHQLLSKPCGVSNSESTLVHYAQQQARREAESTAIRRQRNELEVALRDAEIRGDKLMDQANVLKEEIRKLERDRSRESANLEYLKNIVLRFMMSTSYSVKQQMITAIGTILEFSPKELNQVRKVQSATWWGT